MKKILIVIIIIACVGFVIFQQFYSQGEESEVSNDAPKGVGTALNVNGKIVRETSLNNDIRITGSLIANESIVLKSEVSGIVEGIYFKEGQRVKKGQLLIQLNDDEIKAEIEKLQFTKKLNEGIAYRQQQLLASEAISQEEYETVLTTLNTTQADIKVRQVQVRKHQILAPFDGIIGLRNISIGSYLTPTVDIANLYSINPIKLEFSVPGKYAAQVNPGDRFSFTIDAYEEEFTGEIYAVEPKIDPQTRTLTIRGTSANKENKLLPGNFSKIHLTLNTFDKALMVPTEAVIPELGGKKVFVYQNGKANPVNIVTGIRTADHVQVLSGLSKGDTIITSGILQMRPGILVSIDIQTGKL